MSLFDIGISVVVLTKNNEDTIGACLDSVLKQDYDTFEVLIIDGGSSDGTIDILKKYERKLLNGWHDVKLYHSGNIGESRQLGVERSKYPLIAFIDSDCELPNKSWLSDLERYFRDPANSDIAGIFVTGAYKKDYPSIARYSILSFWALGDGIPCEVTDKNYFPVGCGHILIRKSIINKVGGFKSLKAGEDIDITKRICSAGYVFMHQCLPVYHLHASSLKQYISKYKRDVENTLVLNEKPNYLKFIVNNIILPVPITVLGLIDDKDIAWLWHPVICLCKSIVALKAFLHI